MNEFVGKDNSEEPMRMKGSPWRFTKRVKMQLWEWTWTALCLWTPKPFNRWRLLCLRLYGAKICGNPFVHQRARILMPWNIVLRDSCCIGDRANLYSLGPIEVGEGAVVALITAVVMLLKAWPPDPTKSGILKASKYMK